MRHRSLLAGAFLWFLTCGRSARKQRDVIVNKKETKFTIDLAQAMDDEDQVIDQQHYVEFLKTK